MWHTGMMKTHPSAPDYKGYRFPPVILSHGVWLSFRFSLSYRDVEELLAQRGMVVTYETVRQWCLKCGQMSANELRHRRPRSGDTWYMDEVVLTIRGKQHSLCWLLIASDRQLRPLRTLNRVFCSLPIPQRKSKIENIHLLIFTKG
jgi:putative transposase